MRPGFPQTGVQPGYMQPGPAQAGYSPPVQPGTVTPGLPPAPQGAINSGLPPAPQGPGYAKQPQSGAMQAGYAQAGVAAQPGYAQPGMAPQPGYSQPGLANAQSAYAPPAAGGMMAGAAGYGQPGLAAPGGAYGAAPGYQAGMAQPGYGARGAPSPGFGHGAYSPGVRPILSSIRKTNTTLKQTAYGTGVRNWSERKPNVWLAASQDKEVLNVYDIYIRASNCYPLLNYLQFLRGQVCWYKEFNAQHNARKCSIK